MELTEEEQQKIRKILLRSSRFAWNKPGVIEKVIDGINLIRKGTSPRKLDQPISEYTTMSWKDYYMEIGLLEFVETG